MKRTVVASSIVLGVVAIGLWLFVRSPAPGSGPASASRESTATSPSETLRPALQQAAAKAKIDGHPVDVTTTRTVRVRIEGLAGLHGVPKAQVGFRGVGAKPVGPPPATGRGSARYRAIPVDGGEPTAWTAADADGVVTFEGLGFGAHRIVACRSPLSAQAVLGEIPAAGMAAPTPEGPTVKWFDPADGSPKATDEARVLGPDGAPLAAFQVKILLGGGGFGGYGEGKEGVLHRSPSEDWDTAYQFFPAPSGPHTFEPIVWKAQPGDVSVPVVQLPHGRVVRGQVVDAAGAGVAGAELHARPRSDDGKDWALAEVHGRAKTDGNGSFEMRSLGRYRYEIESRLPSPFVQKGVWRFDENAVEVKFDVERGFEVTVTVEDYEGRPLSGVKVRGIAPLLVPGGTFGGSTFPISEPLTDGDGKARVGPLDAGKTIQLVLDPPKDRLDLVPWIQHEWQPADQTIRLERGYVLKGAVHDAEGRPTRASVERKDPTGRFVWLAASGTDGTFAAGRLPSGRVTVRAATIPTPTAQPIAGPERTVDAGDEHVDLTLAR